MRELLSTNFPKRQWTLRMLFVVVAFAALIVAIYVAGRRLDERAREVEHLYSMRKVIIGFLNQSGPVRRRSISRAWTTDINGEPACSWRYEMCQWTVHHCPRLQCDIPWNDPSHAEVRRQVYSDYCWTESARDNNHTNIFAITGPGTAFDPTREQSIADLDADTVLLVEVVNSKTHWMQPGDFDIRTMPRNIGRGINGETCISSESRRGFLVGFADGVVWRVSYDISFEQLSKFFTVDSAKTYDRDVVLSPFRTG